MLTPGTQGRCCSSPSAPTPRRGRLEKLGKVAVVLRRRFRSTLNFTSPSTYTRDVSAHESAAVRRHFAPGATEKACPIVGCACALAASVGIAHRWQLCLCRNCISYTPVHAQESLRMSKKSGLETEFFTLTERQCEVLKYLVRENDNGGSATVRDICDHFGWAGPNAAHEHLRILARKGLIVLPGNKRRFRLTRTAINLYSKRPFATAK